MDEKNYLFAFDFDGTIGDTFEKSPNGIGVNEACAMAVHDLFGKEGMDVYELIGGLANRAPVELINALLIEAELRGVKDVMLAHVKQFAREHLGELNAFMPEGKGASIDSLRSSAVPETSVFAEAFVRAKLNHLIPEIGTTFTDGREGRWPQPMPGIIDALAAVRALKGKNVNVHIAVLSSGHEMFIRKCFELWGVAQPNILVTDDDLRGVSRLSPDAKMKPSVYLLAELRRKWRGLVPTKHIRREQMMYAGDDFVRDRQLVTPYRVMFGWFNPNGESRTTADPHLFEFRDWNELTEFLTTPGLEHRLEEGEALSALLKEMRSGLHEGRFPRLKRPV